MPFSLILFILINLMAVLNSSQTNIDLSTLKNYLFYQSLLKVISIPSIKWQLREQKIIKQKYISTHKSSILFFNEKIWCECQLLIIFIQEQMSCKENFSLFENQIPEIQTPLPFHPIPDEMKEIIRESSSVYMSGINFDILLNKFVNNLQITDIELQQLSEHQRLVLEHMKLKTKTKVKRSDQCHKLFYKKAFKYAQNQYFHRKKAKSRKMSQFYHHHFDTVAQKEGLPITSFYHPDKKTKPGLKVSFKTFNINYIRLLLRSKSFRGTVKHYHKVFPDECLKERQKKIKSFTSSIRKIINLAQNDSKILIEYLQSSQCKIPWTWGQIKQAQRIAEVELVKAEAHENEKKEQSDTPLDDIMNITNELMCDEQREQFIEDQFDEEQQESLFAKLLR